MTPKIEDYPYEYWHTCGKPAFFLRHMPGKGEAMKSEMVAFPNGEAVEPMSALQCGSCGRFIWFPALDHIRLRFAA